MVNAIFFSEIKNNNDDDDVSRSYYNIELDYARTLHDDDDDHNVRVYEMCDDNNTQFIRRLYVFTKYTRLLLILWLFENGNII